MSFLLVACYDAAHRVDVAQLVEHHLAKVKVAGSSPVFHSKPIRTTDLETMNTETFDLLRTLQGTINNLDQRQMRSASAAVTQARQVISDLVAELDAANEFIDRNCPAALSPEEVLEASDRAKKSRTPDAYFALTFDDWMTPNRARSVEWHLANSEAWSGADWSNAMVGEAGEAANVVKKLRRLETGTKIQNDRDSEKVYEDLVEDLGRELADTMMYIDLVACHYKIHLPRALVEKFNEVSDKYGFEQKIQIEED